MGLKQIVDEWLKRSHDGLEKNSRSIPYITVVQNRIYFCGGVMNPTPVDFDINEFIAAGFAKQRNGSWYNASDEYILGFFIDDFDNVYYENLRDNI